MNDSQINYFLAVATNLSFTKTSEELFVSQPAISKQISQLEKELGAKLFIRNNKTTQLTEVGKLYYELFTKYKSEFFSTKLEAEKILELENRLIRVGFLEGWDLFGIIPSMIEEFKKVYPDSEIVINCCGVKELSNLIISDRLDIALTMKNSLTPFTEIHSCDVAELDKLLLYSANNEHANIPPSELSMSDFRKEKFIAPWSIVDDMIINAITSYTRPYGFIPDITFVRNHESMITCVRNDMGVAIVDEWVWAKNANDLKWIPIEAKDTISLARSRSNRSDIVTCMEEILTNIITNLKDSHDS